MSRGIEGAPARPCEPFSTRRKSFGPEQNEEGPGRQRQRGVPPAERAQQPGGEEEPHEEQTESHGHAAAVNELKEENERLEAKIKLLSKELSVLKDLFLEHAHNLADNVQPPNVDGTSPAPSAPNGQ
ncbi:hypothetical protein WMY93_013791 [Mugilogobius chulae]|uniref:Uncharacterized protein n=1 Tax=Mugilogobius chulae TaxID=88201 RepID=A0AAW0P0J7_9GOBI